MHFRHAIDPRISAALFIYIYKYLYIVTLFRCSRGWGPKYVTRADLSKVKRDRLDYF